MAWVSRYITGVTLSACSLFSSLPALAQGTLGGTGPSNTPGMSADRQPAASTGLESLSQRAAVPASTTNVSEAEQAARDLAVRYLDLWSAPKQVTRAAASSFYAPTVTFHGQRRTLAAVVAEKRRFAQRWPNRDYRHRPETTQVRCEDDALRCTVRSSFDFQATNTQRGQRSSGVGEHELVVAFTNGMPMIVAENSQVIIRGHGNMTELLGDDLRRR
jgi:hypothetical protein